jgi:SAM-dependent methyltransferase
MASGFWALYARVYDTIWDAPLTREVADAVAGVLPTGVDVVDVGCGTGLISGMLTARGHRVTGVDVSVPMLTRAREQGRLAVTVVADAAAIDLPAGDAVVAVNVLHVHPDPDAVLAEIVELLRPGGVAVLVWPTDRVSIGRLFRVERRLGRSRGSSVRAAILRGLVAVPGLVARVPHHADGALAAAVDASALEVVASREVHGVQRLVLVRPPS